MKPINLKPIEVGYGDEKVIIHPRMISVAEQNSVHEQLTDIADTDTEKYQKEFQILRDALDEFSAQPAERLEKVKGEFKRLPIEGGLAAHFANRTNESERIVRKAYELFVEQLSPDGSFM